MGKTTAEYRRLAGTRASVGRAGAHSVIADRPEGKSGGMGLGFNGGELLALALGGCLSNDIEHLAEQMGLEIADLAISVNIDFDGEPTRARSAGITVDCRLVDGSDPAELIERAKSDTTISNSLIAGIPVAISRR